MGQCECCYPAWDSSTPDYTFLVPYLNATSMPDLWSYNVSLVANSIQQFGKAAVSHAIYLLSIYCDTATASHVASSHAQFDV